MTARMVRKAVWGRGEFALATSEVAEKGKIACIDTSTGTLKVAQTSTTLIPIGYFDKSMTGDGSTLCPVELFSDMRLHWFDNDSAPNAVDGTMIMTECYLKDGATVSALSTSRSKAGRVLAVSATEGVLVQLGVAVTGPTGPSAVSATLGGVATRAALTAIAAASRYDGMLVMVRSDGSLWRFVSASSVTVDGAGEFALAPDSGTGRWFRANASFTAKIPVAFGMADGATILTVPAGFVLRLTGLPFWEVLVSWTGGSSSTIGVAASITGYTTAGDLLGGAAGDAAAALTAGIRPGTVGPKLDTPAEVQAFVLQGADTLTYEEITSAFTAGNGYVCLPISVSIAG